MQTYVNHII